MSRVKATNAEEEKILRDNHLDPSRFGVLDRTDGKIVLLCYSSGCRVIIEEGLKKW